MPVWSTLASIDDVKHAGNLSDRILEDSLRFYLDIASYFLHEMIGATNYDAARQETLVVPFNDMLKKAEACLAVGFALPAVAVKTTEQGIVKQMAMARGGEYQNMSFAKEIRELAESFISMANFLIPSEMIEDEDSYNLAWYHVIQTVFPGLDEFPTRGTIHSAAEEVIQTARGAEGFVPDGVD